MVAFNRDGFDPNFLPLFDYKLQVRLIIVQGSGGIRYIGVVVIENLRMGRFYTTAAARKFMIICFDFLNKIRTLRIIVKARG